MTIRHHTRPPRTCPKCEAPVAWWRNANQPDEKWLCVDASSDDTGTVQKIVNDDPDRPGHKVVWGRRLTGPDLAEAVSNRDMLFTLHSTTCSAQRPPNTKPEGLHIDWPDNSRRRA